MRASPALVGAAAMALSLAAAQAPSIDDYSQQDIADGTAWANVTAISWENMQNNIDSRGSVSCTYDNAEVRPEWNSMATADRQAFTAAVECLQSTGPKYMTSDQAGSYPGVKTRYDEYVATHINYTFNIHATADFFAWHRYFIWALHDDLKSTCGYSGPLPYWDWPSMADAPQENAMFNGDANSFGSNGEYVADRDDTYLGDQNINFPPGTGGGCVTSGPFVNHTCNLGPVDSPYGNSVQGHFDYNPRCLVRDINPWFTTRYLTYTNVTELTLQNIYVEDFQALMQGYNSDTNKLGCHGGGHWSMGGPSEMEDFHSSPNDPLFFLHHAMVDRVWTVWQNLDITRRQNIISGTSTLNNDPPSDAMTLDDTLPFGFVRPDIRFGDVMDTFSGPFCYRYT